jgi:hypothetical protein
MSNVSIIYTEEDLRIMVTTIYFETEKDNFPIEDIIAIGWVIRNLPYSSKYDKFDIAGACKNNFIFWSLKKSLFSKRINDINEPVDVYDLNSVSTTRFKDCEILAKLILNGQLSDPTYGSTSFIDARHVDGQLLDMITFKTKINNRYYL